MTLGIQSKRRALFQSFPWLLLLLALRKAIGQPKKDGAQGTDGAQAGEAEPAEVQDGRDGAHAANDATKKGKVVLIVVVQGSGKPISKARVQVTPPPSVGTKLVLHTDQKGIATFKFVWSGTADVSVVASGWVSEMKQNVVLKVGKTELSFQLKPLDIKQ